MLRYEIENDVDYSLKEHIILTHLPRSSHSRLTRLLRAMCLTEIVNWQIRKRRNTAGPKLKRKLVLFYSYLLKAFSLIL